MVLRLKGKLNRKASFPLEIGENLQLAVLGSNQ